MKDVFGNEQILRQAQIDGWSPTLGFKGLLLIGGGLQRTVKVAPEIFNFFQAD
jgi:hypothetical protein